MRRVEIVGALSSFVVKIVNFMMGLAIVIILFLIFAIPAFAFNDFYEDKAQGWFWYEQEPEEPEEPEIPPPPLPAPAPVPEPSKEPEPKKIKPLSVEWFEKEYLNLLGTAIDDPSPENVKKYRYATRVMLDKASNFTHAFQRESLLDPMLDESNRMPFASAARGSFMRLTIQEQTKATKAIGQKAGLWVFLDESCAFCALQYPIISRMVKDRKFEAIYITPDGQRPSWMAATDDVRKDDGQSKYLRIGVRPAVAFVAPPENITVLTQGMLSQDLLEERILFAGDQAGMLTAEISGKAFPERKGLLTTQDIQDIGEEMLSNPNVITQSVQDRLEKRY